MLVGTINPNIFNKKLKEGQKPTTRKTALISFLVLGILGMILATIAVPSKAATDAIQSTPEPTKTASSIAPSQTNAPVVEGKDIEDPAEFAKAATLKYFSSADVTFNDGDGTLEIKASGKDNVTDDLIKVGIQSGITDTLKALKDRPEIKDVVFKVTLEMSDKLGNVSNDVVVQATLLKATRDKINWDNFSYSSLPDIADSYGGHFSK